MDIFALLPDSSAINLLTFELLLLRKYILTTNIMPISKSTEESTRTGIYHVKESGLDYEHLRDAVIPKDGKEYLDIFK